MSIKVKTIQSTDTPAWDAYVHSHPHSTLYHLSGWKNVIEKTYGHKTYYLMAINSSKLKAQSSRDNCITANQLTAGLIHAQSTDYQLSAKNIQQPELSNPINPSNPINSTNPIVGILPLVHLKHLLFGNSLISIPFFDLGGILADDKETEKVLLSEAIKLGEDLEVNHIELRHIKPLSWLNKTNSTNTNNPINSMNPTNPVTYETKSHKIRMLLDLPKSSEILMKSFKSKLRNKIKRPLKEGWRPRIGGLELLEDFYKVFSINMRHLGSPVHSKKLMKNVLEEFPESTKIVMVYQENQPLACSLIVGFKDTLENPWASALREYSRLRPNTLLYWTMLEYASDHGFNYFDFGRSSPDEGTYKFKEQWGAKPTPLHWHYVSLNGHPFDEETPKKSKFEKAIRYWQKLPVPVTKVVGPMIRKYIGL